MRKNIVIGLQDFEKIRRKNCFYIDKTSFIKEWWENEDDVTLITRPRRFGKTLNMSMLECFFSLDYASRGDLFEGLSIWEEEKYRKLQGTYPVISLSFSKIKETNFEATKMKLYQLLVDLYDKNYFLMEQDFLRKNEKQFFSSISMEMPEFVATEAINKMCSFLYRYYGKKVIILLDEYDTPMQEAYENGYWDKLAQFTRSLFNATFKTNPYMECSIMTGITRVSKESIFSDLNNLKVVTTTSDEYATAFGFTEEEVFQALEEYGFSEEKEGVKLWYDGFVFGKYSNIYNPWSVINFLDAGKYNMYWANTSENSLVGRLIQKGSRRVKMNFEKLLKEESIECSIDEQILYNQLDRNEASIWSLLLASGYLKVESYEKANAFSYAKRMKYRLRLTNGEVIGMFQNMVYEWFAEDEDYNEFVIALLLKDIDAMNKYMNRVALQTFSCFDSGKKPSEEEPERFYHGFVLGLLVEFSENYRVLSNRESGFGRYDVVIEPKNLEDDAFILEFKVHDPKKEKTLEDTVKVALAQIEEKQYEIDLITKGIKKENIYRYGFAFQGKKVLIG